MLNQLQDELKIAMKAGDKAAMTGLRNIIGKLKKRPQFLKVAANGKKWITPGFILQVRPHKREEQNLTSYENIRVGYTVSKNVGNAVVRNRVKRRLRALVANVVYPYAKFNMDCVLIGRKNAKIDH